MVQADHKIRETALSAAFYFKFKKYRLLDKILRLLIVLGGLAIFIKLFQFTALGQVAKIIPNYVLNISIFFGLSIYYFLTFVRHYFVENEDKIKLPESVTSIDEIYTLCDFDTIYIMDEYLLKNNFTGLAKLFSKSNEIMFILSKMGVAGDKITINKLINFGAVDGLNIFSLMLEQALKEPAVNYITKADLFYVLLKQNPAIQEFLMSIDLNEEDLVNIISWSKNLFSKFSRPKTISEKLLVSNGGFAQNWSSGYTLTLDRFGVDYTVPNSFNGISIKSREHLLEQLQNVLTGDSSNSCILLGRAGVGKRTIVKELAANIYWGKVMPALMYKRIVALDAQVMMSSSASPQELLENLTASFNDTVRAGNIILFIDNFEVFLKGNETISSIDASDVLNKYLERSDFKLIAATDQASYSTYIQPKGGIASKLSVIQVEPTNKNETIQSMEDISIYLAAVKGQSITYDSLKEIYQISESQSVPKDFPGRAIDLLNSISNAAKNKGIKFVTKKFVDEIAEEIFNIPIREADEVEKVKLLNLEKTIHQRVIGQEEAVVAVSNSLRRARTNVGDSKRPMGSFLFVGPTGVGKTELSKALAATYFGDENKMVRMDMNQFQDTSGLDRFIGKKIVGQQELDGGEFVKKARQMPFSVVLLDEIEKAHPDILNLFLQLLDEGYITDGMGEKILFKNNIIIATSNAGANLIRTICAEGKDISKEKEQVLEFLQNNNLFKPEFLNRFDDIILFRSLNQEEVVQIAKIFFDKLHKKLLEQGFDIDFDQDLLTAVAEAGYKPEFGAREIRRVFQDMIENSVARKILEGGIVTGQKVIIGADILPPEAVEKS